MCQERHNLLHQFPLPALPLSAERTLASWDHADTHRNLDSIPGRSQHSEAVFVSASPSSVVHHRPATLGYTIIPSVSSSGAPARTLPPALALLPPLAHQTILHVPHTASLHPPMNGFTVLFSHTVDESYFYRPVLSSTAASCSALAFQSRRTAGKRISSRSSKSAVIRAGEGSPTIILGMVSSCSRRSGPWIRNACYETLSSSMA